MDQAVATLQNAINRFAAVGGFPRVGVDGLWGTQTKTGVRNALLWIGQSKCYQSSCTDPNDAATATGLLAQWDESSSAAKGLGAFLVRVADDLGVPHVAVPVITGGGGGGITPSRLPAHGLAIMDRLRALSLWQQILLGFAAGLGLIYVAKRIRGQSAKPRRA